MRGEPFGAGPRYSRKGPLVALLFCVVLLLVTASMGRFEGAISLTILFLAAPISLLAVGGLIDPRLLWSIGPQRHEMPISMRIIGAVLALLGAGIAGAITIWLVMHEGWR